MQNIFCALFFGSCITSLTMKLKNDRNNVAWQNKINDICPKSLNQQLYVNALKNDETKIIIVTGPAGTGKTLFACKTGINLLKSGELKKIVITRPMVTVEEEMGFLPGNIEKKMNPWMRPVLDIFSDYYSQREIDQMVSENVIEISPLAFMRGRTFTDTFIIADEMQNSSPNQMQMLTTRIGKGSRLVISGDLHQSDRIASNGLKDIVGKIKTYYTANRQSNLIELVSFDLSDIQRSKIVKHVLDIYNYTPSVEKDVPYIKPMDFDAFYKRPIQNPARGC